MASKLPPKIYILDIETEKTKFKNPEKSKLAFVGIKTYVMHKDRYYPCKHRIFLPEQYRELEKFLKGFNGIIIGHNILQFDYRVLSPLISLDGVIEKSVDTLAFFYKKNGKYFNGLSLNNLSQINFGKEKTIRGKFISELWHSGKRKKVIEYNENDCKLTKTLWWCLVTKRSIEIFGKSFNVSSHDISYLIGKRPLFTFNSWEQKIERDGYIFSIFQKKNKDWKICPWCGKNIFPITCSKKDFDDYLKKYVNIDNMSEGQFAEYITEASANVFPCSKCIRSLLKK